MKSIVSKNWKKIPVGVRTFFVIICEFVVIYAISNLPFILVAFESSDGGGVFTSYVNALTQEVNKGELLVFVCALIAPIIWWCLQEENKVSGLKLLLICCGLLIFLSGISYGRDAQLLFVQNTTIYWSAVVLWGIHMFFRDFPPPKEDYTQISTERESNFVAATRKENHEQEVGDEDSFLKATRRNVSGD